MICIGTSGWSYAHWTNVLYPEGLLPRERLDRLRAPVRDGGAERELLPLAARAAFAWWRRRLPAGFVMSVKAPGLLTHAKRLYGPERWVERIARGVARLGDRAGPVLVQLSPHQPVDEPRLAYFLARLPAGLRVAVELRHPSWHTTRILDLLERHGAAYCVMSGARLPCVLRATARFVYVRLHGPDREHLYAGSYSDDDLRWWADRVREWAGQGRDVYVYFNNDGFGHAVRNAATLRWMVGA